MCLNAVGQEQIDLKIFQRKIFISLFGRWFESIWAHQQNNGCDEVVHGGLFVGSKNENRPKAFEISKKSLKLIGRWFESIWAHQQSNGQDEVLRSDLFAVLSVRERSKRGWKFFKEKFS